MALVLKLTRDQIAKIVGNDPRAIKQFEKLQENVEGSINETEEIANLVRGAGAQGAAALAREGREEVVLLNPPVAPFLLDSRYLNVRSVTAGTTLTAYDDVLLVDASGGDVTVSLPALVASAGKVFHVKKTDSSANTVTLDGDGSETIDGATTIVTATQYTAWSVCAGPSEWSLL